MIRQLKTMWKMQANVSLRKATATTGASTDNCFTSTTAIQVEMLCVFHRRRREHQVFQVSQDAEGEVVLNASSDDDEVEKPGVLLPRKLRKQLNR